MQNISNDGKWQVITNKYSHAGSGFSYVESTHATREAADAHATKIRPGRRWAIVEQIRTPAEIDQRQARNQAARERNAAIRELCGTSAAQARRDGSV